jgi:hypothetical protein
VLPQSWAISGPLSTARADHLRYLTGTLRRLNSRLPGALAANFQAGHASSILVTRSTAKPLVKGLFRAAVMLLRDCPPRSGLYAGHWLWRHQFAP